MIKKSIKKNFRIAILTLSIVAIPHHSKAQFSGGNGTSTSPYQIATETELAQLATYVNAGDAVFSAPGVHYKLVTSISLSDSWTPIGNETNPFKGTFDGGSNQITNLDVNLGCAGLFGCIFSNATVKNLGLIEVNINTGYSGTSYAGGLVGINQGSVENCYSTGAIVKNSGVCNSSSSNYAYLGGLVGDNQGSVLNSYSNCTVTAVACVHSSQDNNYTAYSFAGGVVGYNQGNGNVSSCYATGTIEASATTKIFTSGDVYAYACAGGVVGNNKGAVSNSYSTGNINSTSLAYATNNPRSIYSISRAGGVAGINHGYGNVSNCYAIGVINSSATSQSSTEYTAYCYNYPYSYSGGVVGENDIESSVSDCAALNSRIICTSTSIQGANSTTYRDFGRVAGYNYGTLTNNIAFNNMINPSNTTSWNNNIGASNINGADYTIYDINTNNTLGGRFVAPIWTTQDGKLPGLFGNLVEMPPHLYLVLTPPTINTTTLPDGMVGTEYNKTLWASGTMPITWSIENGSLPNGLELSGSTIHGIPSVAGSFTFSIKATNSEGSDIAQLSILIAEGPVPPTILTTSVPDGTVGEYYSFKLTAVGDDPILWYAPSFMPASLFLSQSGMIVGTPNDSGTFTFTVMANNDAGSDFKDLTITIKNKEIGIIETENTSLNIYPNPAKEILNFNLDAAFEIADLKGNILLKSDKKVKFVNINSLPSGVYIVTLINETEKTIKKLIKE